MPWNCTVPERELQPTFCHVTIDCKRFAYWSAMASWDSNIYGLNDSLEVHVLIPVLILQSLQTQPK